MATGKSSSLPRKIVVFLAKTMMTLALALLFALAGALLWLRSDHAVRFLADMASDALFDLNLHLDIGQVEGPLPERLLIRNLTLSDEAGPLLKAGIATVETNPLALLAGRLDISLIRLERPELIRLPKLPESTAEPQKNSLVLAIPIEIVLEKMDVVNGLLHSSALLEQTGGDHEKSPAAQLPELVTLECNGSASLRSQEILLKLAVALGNAEGRPVIIGPGQNRPPASAPAPDKAENTSQVPLLLNGLAVYADIRILPGPESIQAKAGGNIRAETDAEPLDVNYNMTLDWQAPTVFLRSLRLDGLGLATDVRGKINTDTLAASANVKLDAANDAPWQSLLASLAGLDKQADGSPEIGGNINLFATLDFDGLARTPAKNAEAPQTLPIHGAIILQAADLRWPSAQLATMLGRRIDATLDFESALPLSDGQIPACLLRLNSLNADIFDARGKISFVPTQPDAATADSAQKNALSGHLEAELQTTIRKVQALTQDGVSGALSLETSAWGAPASLDINLEVYSPALVAAAGSFKDVQAFFNGKNDTRDGATLFAGDIKAVLGDSPGGPVALGGKIRARLPLPDPENSQAQDISAGLSDFFIRGAGLLLSANLNADIPLSANATLAAPRLQGTLDANVKDWSKLAALTGLPLSGDPASLDLRLGNSVRGQTAELTASLPRLLFKEPDQTPLLRLHSLNATFTASDIFGAPSLDMTLRTGQGKAAFLLWDSGEATVNGSNGKGDFKLSLRGRKQDRGSKTASAESLGFYGRYDLSAQFVSLNGLSLYDRRSQTGLALSRPVALDFADGVRIKDLALNFTPGGKLGLEASFAPGTMAAQFELSDLPFAVFALFGGSALPDGMVSAKAEIKNTAAGPQGVFSINSTLSAGKGINAKSRGGLRPAMAAGIGSPAPTESEDASLTNSAPSAASALTLAVSGRLGQNPGPALVGGTGIKAAAGRVWLSGQGVFGGVGKTGADNEGALAFQLPLLTDPNGIPAPDKTAPLAVTLNYNGQAAALWQALPMPDRYLDGLMRVEASLSGSFQAPQGRVRAYLANGRYEDIINGILVSGIDLEVKSDEKGGLGVLASANDGRDGHFALQADISELQGASTKIKARGQLKKFRPLHRDDLDIVLTGLLGLNGPADSPLVTGDIIVEQGEFIIGGSNINTAPVLNPVVKSPAPDSPAQTPGQATDQEDQAIPGPELDIKLSVPRYFFIRGLGLDSEWKGYLAITGTAAAPSLRGELAPVRGYFDIFSRTFKFDGGKIDFAGGQKINPALSLELSYEGPDITAFIKTGGTAKTPTLQLESRPPLPRDEVLAKVLFGKQTSELSRFEAIQLANNMRSLLNFGESGFDPLSNMRKRFGLDMLRIGSSSGQAQRSSSGQSGEGNLLDANGGEDAGTGAPALEAGKYINDSIYVGLEQGATENSTAVRVEVELFPQITLEGKSSADSSEVGVGWKRDY